MRLRERMAVALTGHDFAAEAAAAKRDRGAIMESLSVIADRAREDLGWQNLAEENPFGDTLPVDAVRQQSRLAFANDPYAKRATLLTTAFAFGQGIDGPTAPEDDPGLEVLQEFWNDPHNQATMFGTNKQYQRSNELQVDGELVLLVFTGATPVQVRVVDVDLISERVPHPEDTGRALYYRVEYEVNEFDAEAGGMRATEKTRRVYYPDILNRGGDDDLDPIRQQIPEEELAEDTYLMRIPLNILTDGQRGVPDSAASLRHLSRLVQITGDQATISRSTAALMNQMAVTGDPAQVEAIANRLAPSTTQEGDDPNHHVPPLPGANTVHNDAVKLETGRASTNAVDARTNARLMKMGAVAGFGFSLHYLGDPENANLATATSMELPVLRTMQVYQALWNWIYRTLCDLVLEVNGVTDESHYDLPSPAIVQHPLVEVSAAVLDALDAGRISDTQASVLLMTALGVDNIELELAALNAEADAAPDAPDVTEAMAELERRVRATEGAAPDDEEAGRTEGT